MTTPAPADRPCGCEQSQALTQDLADARSQLEAHAEDSRELFAQLAAANARVAELEAQLAGKVEMVANWRVVLDALAQKYIDARAELAALRSRLDPGNVEAVERVAKAMWDAGIRRAGTGRAWDLVDGLDDCREDYRDDARAALTALSGGG